MPTENLNCPRCGAALQVTLNNQLVTCAYCHSTIRISSSKTNDPYLSENDRLAEISQALTRLLQRSKGEGGVFVEFLERQSQKFVQFFTIAGNSLILDLPSQTLSSMETECATKFFRDLGARGSNAMKAQPDPSVTKSSGTLFTFQLKFDQDVESAARMTLAIFRQVYQFPIDFNLIIEES